MSKQTEALKLALEALENLPEMCGIEEAITAVQEALAEKPAQQEPEPDRVKFERHWRKTRGDKKANRELPRHPLQPQTYIQDSANRHWVTWQAAVRSVSPQPAQQQEPVAWLEILRNNKTATDEVVGAFLRGHAEHLTRETFVLSTPAAPQPVQPQQEPVAWKDEQGNVRMTLDSGEIQSSVGYVYSVHGERIKNACIRSDIPNGTPLYTSPPAQRKPLTDEEIWKFWWSRPEVPDGEDDSMEAEFVAAVRRILAAYGIKENT